MQARTRVNVLEVQDDREVDLLDDILYLLNNNDFKNDIIYLSGLRTNLLQQNIIGKTQKFPHTTSKVRNKQACRLQIKPNISLLYSPIALLDDFEQSSCETTWLF